MNIARPPPKTAELFTSDVEKMAAEELPPIQTAPPVPRMLSGSLEVMEVGRGERSAELLAKSERVMREAGTSLMNRPPPLSAEDPERMEPLKTKVEQLAI